MKCLVDNETKCFCEGVTKNEFYNYFYATYTIDSQEKFEAWVNNTTGNNYKNIIIVGGYGSGTNGEYETDTEINLTTTGTKTIQGVKDAKIISSATNGIVYRSLPSENDYWIRDLKITCNVNAFSCCINLNNCIAVCTQDISCYAFYSCTNLNNCTGNTTASIGDSIAFFSCTNLNNCTGNSISDGTDVACYGFDDCKNLNNCVGSFAECNAVFHCKKGSNTTDRFTSSYASWTNNSTYVCADTPNGGFNKTT